MKQKIHTYEDLAQMMEDELEGPHDGSGSNRSNRFKDKNAMII
jgi:hypothetical protein